MIKKRSLIITPIATAAVLTLSAPAAFAAWTDTASTTGAQATCTVTPVYSQGRAWGSSITCSIKDTSSDGKSVYVDYWVDGYGKQRLSNTSGAGTTVTRSASASSDSIPTSYWAVCRLNTFGDNCSSVVAHKNPS